MTKKDYELIASQLSDGVQMARHGTTAAQTMRSVVYNLSLALALDNPRFDGTKFYTACGLQVCEKCGHTIPLECEEWKHECQE